MLDVLARCAVVLYNLTMTNNEPLSPADAFDVLCLRRTNIHDVIDMITTAVLYDIDDADAFDDELPLLRAIVADIDALPRDNAAVLEIRSVLDLPL